MPYILDPRRRSDPCLGRHGYRIRFQSDWVSGAKQLSQYYASAAQDLERLVEAHEEAARGGPMTDKRLSR
jgi:hypothetical protein